MLRTALLGLVLSALAHPALAEAQVDAGRNHALDACERAARTLAIDLAEARVVARLVAVDTLAHCRSRPATLDALRDALLHDPSVPVRARAAMVLARFPREQALPALRSALVTERSPRVREMIQRGIASFRGVRPLRAT